jgi:hypothetical protein
MTFVVPEEEETSQIIQVRYTFLHSRAEMRDTVY